MLKRFAWSRFFSCSRKWDNCFASCQISKLKCSQCEFLSFKNIDQWKNHVIGHWRLAGMTTDFEVWVSISRFRFQVVFSGCLLWWELQVQPQGWQHVREAEQPRHALHRGAQLQAGCLQVKHFCWGWLRLIQPVRKCNICNLEFAEERKYNSHMRKHDESFQCELCKRKITGRLWYVEIPLPYFEHQSKTIRFERHQKECEGDERPKWAREAPVINPGEDKEVRTSWESSKWHFCMPCS